MPKSSHKAGTQKLPKSFMIYGPPKVGKTTLVCSIIKVPGIKKVLLIDTDLGASAIGEDFPNVDVWEYERGDIKGFQKDWNELKASNGGDWDAVIVDTVTVLQSWKEKSIPKGSGGAAFEKWAEIKEWTLDLMWDLQEMKPIGISCFHVETANIMKGAEEDIDYARLVPNIQGKAKLSIGGIPDVIGYIDVQEDDDGNTIHVAQWRPSGETITGNRFKRIPESLKTDGGMKRLYEYINGTAK
jgi:hypothetical protein